MPYHQNDHETKEITKFYNRVRLHLDDLELRKDESFKIQSCDTKSSVKVSEEELYGLISKEEFINILCAYDKQQESQELQEKPVACSKVIGGTFAKLLYSKPGFHHLGSTSHLVKHLEIRNIHGNSFLGGHSTYSPNQGEDLAGLKSHHDKISIKHISDQAIYYIETNQLDLACREITKAYSKDPRNGDVLATRGRYYMAKKEYVDAIRFFKSALNHRPYDEASIRLYLSDTLYQYGLSKYNRREDKEAKELLGDALKYNPDNQGAKLHRQLCEDRLRQNTLFGQKPPAYRK